MTEQRPQRWKRIIVRAVVFGASFAITGALLAGVVMWYLINQPSKPPAPWNTKAITATYDGIGAFTQQNSSQKEEKYLYFSYILENHTDDDYSFSDDDQSLCTIEHSGLSSDNIKVVAKLESERSISVPVSSRTLCIEQQLFLPARQRALLTIHVLHDYPNPPRAITESCGSMTS
jgi:hypothetical protein